MEKTWVEETIRRGSELARKWIKDDKGETWICPVDVPTNSPEAVLLRRCVRESENPQSP